MGVQEAYTFEKPHDEPVCKGGSFSAGMKVVLRSDQIQRRLRHAISFHDRPKTLLVNLAKCRTSQCHRGKGFRLSPIFNRTWLGLGQLGVISAPVLFSDNMAARRRRNATAERLLLLVGLKDDRVAHFVNTIVVWKPTRVSLLTKFLVTITLLKRALTPQKTEEVSPTDATPSSSGKTRRSSSTITDPVSR
ncbi:hypothetical protein CLF_103661 [Clonorchis sinensis]|uniref:Uncharacterized protein n=1 Tax=Clonorchis sinensis TaxID=79923 RepID=G7YA51_CLOSI|nr:hypothetical protein CLF_103661 [Clonorchis sinensis]